MTPIDRPVQNHALNYALGGRFSRVPLKSILGATPERVTFPQETHFSARNARNREAVKQEFSRNLQHWGFYLFTFSIVCSTKVLLI
jgi:hypothetical protein